MATQPPRFPVPAPSGIADRRAPERRVRAAAPVDRSELIRNGVGAAIAVCGGLAVLFVFFTALGAIDVGNAIAATAVACAFAAVWAGAFVYRNRHRDDRITRHDRERRGF